MGFFVGWHYVKQGYGMLMVDAAQRRSYFAESDKKVLLANSYACWILAWLTVNATAHERNLWGLKFAMLDVPPAVLLFGGAVLAATSAWTAWILLRHARTHRAAVPINGIAAYVACEAIGKLAGWIEPPAESQIGLALVTLSLVVMPLLATAKRRLAHRLGSVTLLADAAETQLCFYLSGIVLIGLAGNMLAGWWWMDPVAALLVGGVAFHEGQRAWTHGDLCGDGSRDAALERGA